MTGLNLHQITQEEKNIDQLKVELMSDSMTCKNNLPWASIACNSCVAKDHQNSLMTQQCHVDITLKQHKSWYQFLDLKLKSSCILLSANKKVGVLTSDVCEA